MKNDKKQYSIVEKEIRSLLTQDRSNMIKMVDSSEEDAEYLEGYYAGRVSALEELLILMNND